MTTISIKLLFACLLSFTLTACQDIPSPESTQTPAEKARPTVESVDTRINTFFSDTFNREVAQNPEMQTSLGLDTDSQDSWFDRSDAAATVNIAETKIELEQLMTFDRSALSNDNRLSFDILEYKLEQTIRNSQFRRQLYVVDQFQGQVTNRVSLLLNAHKIENTKDAEDYIARIIALEGVFEEYTIRLKDRAAFGVMTPAFAYADIINDIGGLGTGYPIDESESRHALLDDFSNKIENLDLSTEAKDALIVRVKSAISGPFKAGIDNLLTEISRQSKLIDGSEGVWSLPNGKAFYKSQIKKYSTLDLSADQVHQMGLDDVARIHKEMLAIMETLGFEGSLQEFFIFARTDPSNFYSNDSAGREAFLADARSQTAEIFVVADQYFNKLPKAGLEVRQVEAWRENSTSIAFYERPSQDGSRPGYYYANLKDMTAYQKSVSTAITYHEGVPGHHFQIALAQELDELPMFRKYGSYGAYTEGWALYAERLAREMGFYTDPMSDFGRLHDEIWRSARLVIDTGIHTKRWTREQAIDYFRQNTPLSEGDMVTEVERFFVWPGQALGYKIGMMKILELRAKAEAELGNAYDIRDFHDVVIGKGGMPLPILEQEVEAYIAAKLQN